MYNSDIVGFFGEPNKRTGGGTVPISIIYERLGIDFQFVSPVWELTKNEIGFITIYAQNNDEDKKICGLCGKKGVSSCGQCLLVEYCSKECQKLHWKVHKIHCNEYFKQK